ncbi:hypothetical protein LPJ59_000034 [Coemansia sp. RSA 2399]|nr:hypothetical protein LPJ59_000034 [Coemansia sp. RSA 2399]KAJ1908533.1 hypothetical protein LPJ81_000034 [Coemansia sp. IMI 209127]
MVEWGDISRKFGGKSATTLQSRYYKRLNQLNIQNTGGGMEEKSMANVRWTAEEDEALRTGVSMYGGRNWGLISRFVGTRVPTQCIIRWRYLGMPLAGSRLPHLHWISLFLRERRQRHLERIATTLGATPQSLAIEGILEKDHKDNSKDAMEGISAPENPAYGRAIKEPFSADEDNMIFRLVRLYGKKWVEITRIFNATRSRNQLDLVQAASDANADSSPHVLPRMVNEIYMRHKQLVSEINRADKKKVPRKRGPSRMRTVAWTEKEDDELIKLVENQIIHADSFTSWKQVASEMTNKNRTATQCMGRWTNYIGTHLKRSPFTEEEDERLWPMVVRHYKLLHTEKEEQNKKNLYMDFAVGSVKLSVGFLGAGLIPGRSRPIIAERIKRLHTIMKWLHVEGNIQDPTLHFNLIHGLANSPAAFRVSARKANAPK